MIKLNTKTSKKATLKMLNTLNSYLFEQECEELQYCTKEQKDALFRAKNVLLEIIK